MATVAFTGRARNHQEADLRADGSTSSSVVCPCLSAKHHWHFQKIPRTICLPSDGPSSRIPSRLPYHRKPPTPPSLSPSSFNAPLAKRTPGHGPHDKAMAYRNEAHESVRRRQGGVAMNATYPSLMTSTGGKEQKQFERSCESWGGWAQ